MGLSREIEEKIIAGNGRDRSVRGRDQGKSTEGYQAALTIKEFHISPVEWGELSRFDKKVLMYQRIMEDYYMTERTEKQKAEYEKEKSRREFLSKHMPKQKKA